MKVGIRNARPVDPRNRVPTSPTSPNRRKGSTQHRTRCSDRRAMRLDLGARPKCLTPLAECAEALHVVVPEIGRANPVCAALQTGYERCRRAAPSGGFQGSDYGVRAVPILENAGDAHVPEEAIPMWADRTRRRPAASRRRFPRGCPRRRAPDLSIRGMARRRRSRSLQNRSRGTPPKRAYPVRSKCPSEPRRERNHGRT